MKAGSSKASAPLRHSTGSPQALFPKLPPGPGHSGEAVIASHQRARICAAMIELVAERDYRAVTVRGLVRAAGVSTRTFYEQFAGKEECFLCTYDLVVARAIQRIAASQRGCADWRERWRRAFAAFVREPKAAQLAFVQAFEVGEPALARMGRAHAAFEAMIAEGFERTPGGVQAPPLLVKGIVAGVERVARVRVLEGREAELPSLADEIAQWVLSYRHPAVAALNDPAVQPHRQAMLPVVDIEDSHFMAGDVQANERVRILRAAAHIAANEGVDRLTAPRVRAAANVSRKCFDVHFEDVQTCFTAALEYFLARALERAMQAGATADDWPVAVHRALSVLMECFAQDSLLARIAFVEIVAAGIPGVRCRARIVGRVADELRQTAPAAIRPSDLVSEASVGAIWEIVHQHVLAGNTTKLPARTGLLTFFVLAPVLGAQEAIEAVADQQPQRVGVDICTGAG